MNIQLENEILKKTNILLEAQNKEYKELISKQQENYIIADNCKNSTIRWCIGGCVGSITIIAIVLISWLLGGYFFSNYTDHSIVSNSNNTGSLNNKSEVNK